MEEGRGPETWCLQPTVQQMLWEAPSPQHAWGPGEIDISTYKARGLEPTPQKKEVVVRAQGSLQPTSMALQLSPELRAVTSPLIQ